MRKESSNVHKLFWERTVVTMVIFKLDSLYGKAKTNYPEFFSICHS